MLKYVIATNDALLLSTRRHRRPDQCINFIVAHDGFTLHDLVAYNGKHNDANGESNRDGNNDNFSWNWCAPLLVPAPACCRAAQPSPGSAGAHAVRSLAGC